MGISSKMASATVTITPSTGEKRVFSEATSDDGGSCKLPVLQKALSKLQKDVNDALSEMVNQEKAKQTAANGTERNDNDNNEEDDEDEDDEDNNKDMKDTDDTNEPQRKKTKL